jgi:hypothetical protein
LRDGVLLFVFRLECRGGRTLFLSEGDMVNKTVRKTPRQRTKKTASGMREFTRMRLPVQLKTRQTQA